MRDGRVAPCSFTTGAVGQPIESIRSPSDLVALPATLALRRLHMKPEPCEDCHSTQMAGKFEMST